LFSRTRVTSYRTRGGFVRILFTRVCSISLVG